jgi:hypothetical protein
MTGSSNIVIVILICRLSSLTVELDFRFSTNYEMSAVMISQVGYFYKLL